MLRMTFTSRRRFIENGRTFSQTGTRGPRSPGPSSSSASRIVRADVVPCPTITMSTIHETTEMARPTHPGQAENAPSRQSTSVAIHCSTRWCGASSMVIHDMKKVGASSTRFRLG